jgi:ferredoxin--NADP+ reductase
MSSYHQESVLKVHHWTDTLFSFTTTRDQGFRFRNGEFTMVGIHVDGKPLVRAYSVASVNYEDSLEFFSIKVPHGPLTSRLQHLKEGDPILVGRKATGTLVVDNLLPGKHLYLLATGTGLAPFLSIIRDPETYERFEKVILIHGCRTVAELAYRDLINEHLPAHEAIGELVAEKLIYVPTVTREPFETNGRLTDLFGTQELVDKTGVPLPTPEDDRVMLCGSPQMIASFRTTLDAQGYHEGNHGTAGHYVVERAFAER